MSRAGYIFPKGSLPVTRSDHAVSRVPDSKVAGQPSSLDATGGFPLVRWETPKLCCWEAHHSAIQQKVPHLYTGIA